MSGDIVWKGIIERQKAEMLRLEEELQSSHRYLRELCASTEALTNKIILANIEWSDGYTQAAREFFDSSGTSSALTAVRAYLNEIDRPKE